MSMFQASKAQIEQKMLLKLMSTLEENPRVSQRHLANELGVALGLMNTYLKRCIKKGWVRANQVPAKRLAYFLTPEGFKEKSRMVKNYLSNSLIFFRDARKECESMFTQCIQKDWQKILLMGQGDLSEIARLVAHSLGLNVLFVHEHNPMDLSSFDAVLITDIENPQGTYDDLKLKCDPVRILCLPSLYISQDVSLNQDKWNHLESQHETNSIH